MNELNEKELEQVAGGNAPAGLVWYHTQNQKLSLSMKLNSDVSTWAWVTAKGYYTVNGNNVAVIYLNAAQPTYWSGWYPEKNSSSFYHTEKLNVAVTQIEW